MKKELRKIGFVLVAAASMLAYSCGGTEEPKTETEPETPEVVVEPSCEPACDGTTCDGGDSTETACDATE